MNNYSDQSKNIVINQVLLIAIILSSVTFFDFKFVPASLSKATQMGAVFIMLFFIAIYRVYDKSTRFKKTFNIELLLLLAGVVLSMFGAYLYHRQGFMVTIIVQRAVYFFLFYYLLHELRLPYKALLNTIIALGVFFFLIYVVQMVLYPREIFHSSMFYQRGTLRIYLSGSSYSVLAYLICLIEYFRTFRVKYLIISVLMFITFLLIGSRQVVFSVLISTVVYLLINKKIKNRVLIFLAAIVGIVPILIIFKDILFSLIEVTQSQSENLQENVRVEAALFFLIEFFPNTITYFIGNGVPSSNSPYGMKINEYIEAFGYFQSDIGIIGEFSKFGAVFILGEIIIMLKLGLRKYSDRGTFIKYTVLIMALTLFTGGGAFGNDENIVMVCILMYLSDYLMIRKKEVST